MTRVLSEVIDELTAPGAEFALTPVPHRGVTVNGFAGSARSLTEAFDLIRDLGDRVAIAYLDQRITYAELVRDTLRIAGALQTRYGVQRGDSISIAMRNYPEWVHAFWAAQLVGAVVVPLNAWSTGPEMRVQLTHARPKVVFADAERLARLEAEYGPAGIDGAALVRVRAGEEGALDSASLDELIAAGFEPMPIEPPSTEDTATILYTSGTTGVPKGVIGTHLNHVSALRGIQLRNLARTIVVGAPAADAPEARALVTFPFFHVAGLVMLYSCVITGKPMYLMYKWDPEEALRLIEEERITELYGPPVVVRDLLAAAEESDRDLTSLRVTSSGGSVTSAAQVDRIRVEFEGRVLPSNAYGLTETTGAIVTQAGQEFFDHPDALGRALPGAQVRIVGPDGAEVPRGEEGEIQVYGSVVSPGYIGDPEATARSFDAGWFRTGDLGTMDGEGRVRLRGRLKDVIIRGAENITCAEVESVIDTFPAVLESAVIGRPDPVMGEEVTAVVRAKDGQAIDVGDLVAHVRSRLAAFKVPSEIVVLDEPLPRTATGKILKSALTRHAGSTTGAHPSTTKERATR